MRLAEFLAKKPLYYKKIDYTRMPRAYERIKDQLRLPPIVHIVGTNAKGSTGRFLAGGLKEAGFKVGHYTSPHILRFNERIWIDGEEASDEALEAAHRRLLRLLGDEMAKALSYFEYTTFLAMLLFEGLDFAVVEAGLGGEHDATAVFGSELTLVTPIDYDHQQFLGETIEQIANAKLAAIKKRAIVGYQSHPEVERIARKYPVKFLRHFPIDTEALKPVVAAEGLAPFFADNLALAIAAAKELGVQIDPKKAAKWRLRGRMERLGESVLLDVGHNPLSARAIEQVLEPGTILVYNSYKDKPYGEILRILAPKLKEVQILPIEDERIADPADLRRAIEAAGLKWRVFDGIAPNERYLVYGSFKVAEEFLRRGSGEVL